MLVISGGQTGADQAGLYAARALGILTGGYAPAGYRTERGDEPMLIQFGLQCTRSREYPPRTRANVALADGTVWFGNPGSRGGKLTLRLADEMLKPVYLIHGEPTESFFQDWISSHHIVTLNVAGNAESHSPGIFQSTYNFLVSALRPWRHN